MSTFSAAVKLIAVVLLASASVVAVPARAWAQAPVTSFDQVPTRVKVGDTVFVTDATGREVKGKVLDLSAASLALRSGSERHEFPAAQVRTLTWQKPDSVIKGTLIGLGIGAAAGVVLGVAADDDYVAIMLGLIGGGIGAGVGAVVDASIPGNKVLVYRASSGNAVARLSIAPILTPTRQGVVIRVSF